ncbi:MAG: glycosyltransferase family 4 protein [Candidatus Omnitrophica bacterium]|nr:glycosyltransferase family 4 protein [Candidatus Omnitrophota bacterium]
MKIGMTTFGGDGGKSGISQYIINLFEQFTYLSNGLAFEAFVYEDEKEIFIPGDADKIKALSFGGKIRPALKNIAWHQMALPGWCRKRNFDVLFLPAANRRIPFRVPCPMVGSVLDFSSLHVKNKYDAAHMFYIKHILPALVRRLNHVITISEASKKDIVEYAKVSPDRVTVIYLAANAQVYYPRDKQQSQVTMAERYGIRAPYILYISRIEHPGKNHVRLIQAFERLKQKLDIPHQLVLAGSDWTQAEVVHETAARSPYHHDIHFTGFFPSSDLPNLYGGADLFVFPSLFEGFGMPILEAMASGIPVACSNISSMPEVSGPAAVLFDPYEIESMEQSMQLLLENPDKSDDYVKIGLERAKQFNWAKTAKKTLEVIEQAAGHK